MNALAIPLDRLPASNTARHALLRDYFCDKDASAIAQDGGWRLMLAWPGGAERHVDPHLQVGLSWWGDNVTLPTMVEARRRTGRIVSVLYDTWTLHSWSECLQASKITADEHLLILHVDDHRDLASPRLFEDNGLWRDAISGLPCDLDRPQTVRAAIETGALGMGSFLTPILHRVPLAEVRHLCQPPKVNSTKDFTIELVRKPDELLDLGRMRPAVTLSPTQMAPGPGHYRLTPDVNDWLFDLPDRPIVLHIDMDYFNNRYDGDTDWKSRPASLDPPIDQILSKIDEVAAALRRPGLAARLVDIVVAYSPGFFPAEHWAVAAERLIPQLERLDER